RPTRPALRARTGRGPRPADPRRPSARTERVRRRPPVRPGDAPLPAAEGRGRARRSGRVRGFLRSVRLPRRHVPGHRDGVRRLPGRLAPDRAADRVPGSDRLRERLPTHSVHARTRPSIDSRPSTGSRFGTEDLLYQQYAVARARPGVAGRWSLVRGWLCESPQAVTTDYRLPTSDQRPRSPEACSL